MNRLFRLFSISIGRKLVVAFSGIMLIGFLVVHMLGNMAIYQGPDSVNAYAAWLQGHPLLWAARLALIGVFVTHVYLALRLALSNRSSRPIAYQRSESVATGFTSRHIVLTGLLVLAFLIYHLLHFTLGQVQPEFAHLVDDQNRHNVYAMMVHGFRNPIVSASYVVAMLILGLHLFHASKSFFQTLGVNHESYNGLIRVVSYVLVSAIVIGNCSIPLLVLAGVIPDMGDL